jgi:hypothetical protein
MEKQFALDKFQVLFSVVINVLRCRQFRVQFIEFLAMVLDGPLREHQFVEKVQLQLGHRSLIVVTLSGECQEVLEDFSPVVGKDAHECGFNVGMNSLSVVEIRLSNAGNWES